MFSFQVSFFEDETFVILREALAHGADALAAARCAWGAGGSLGQRPNVPEARER